MILNKNLINYAKTLGLGFTINTTSALTNKKFNIIWLGTYKTFYLIELKYILRSLTLLESIVNHLKRVKGLVLFTTVTEQYRGIVYEAAIKAKMPCDDMPWQYGNITNYLKHWDFELGFVPDLRAYNEPILEELKRVNIPIVGFISPSVFFKVDFPLFGVISVYNILFYSNLLAKLLQNESIFEKKR